MIIAVWDKHNIQWDIHQAYKTQFLYLTKISMSAVCEVLKANPHKLNFLFGIIGSVENLFAFFGGGEGWSAFGFLLNYKCPGSLWACNDIRVCWCPEINGNHGMLSLKYSGYQGWFIEVPFDAIHWQCAFVCNKLWSHNPCPSSVNPRSWLAFRL